MSKKASATTIGAWTVEEEKKLVSAVETSGTVNNWSKIAANIPGRSEIQCRSKWWNMSRKASAASSGNTKVEDSGDNIPSAETTTDGYTSGDEPPKKCRRCDWV
jgi:hypothetical protein